MTRLSYPAAHTVDQTDVYHGVTIHDPYRWLEDADSMETQAWIEAENAVTYAYLETIPQREAIRKRLTELWDYEKFTMPYRRGTRYFFSHNDGLQNQYVLKVAESRDDAGRVLLDPNGWSDDGTVALSSTAVNEDGTKIAYGISTAGSDWQEWHVRDIATGEDLPDHLHWVKFSGASWTHDGKGFFYSRYDEPAAGENKMSGSNHFRKLFYHRIGDEQSADTLIYERPDKKEWGINGGVTDDGRYLLIYAHRGTAPETVIFTKDLGPQGDDLSAPVLSLFDAEDAMYNVVANDGSLFYVHTENNAPLGRLIAVDAQRPQPEHWIEILPESAETLRGVSLFGDTLYARYLKDAHSQVRIFALDGAPLGEVALPGIGSCQGFNGRRGDAETFYSFTSHTTPGTIYRCDLATGASVPFRKPSVAFDPDQFTTEQIFFTSKDGTRVPMFVTCRRDLVRDGSSPVYLYGYGGFRSAQTPSFSTSLIAWMEMGGVFAVASLRGGGEYGEAWHQAGMKRKKQNVFDDFIAAGARLIADGYTSPSKLAIVGASNGGLLVAACLNQRPDLFGAALPAVGVMDMLRFDKFTIGWAWKADYGSPDDPEEFAALHAYSPIHNIQPGMRYPATLITTSDHDDRVVPAHSYKYAAALQAAQAPDGPPILIRIERKAGHGGGKPTAKIIEETADKMAFLIENLGVSVAS